MHTPTLIGAALALSLVFSGAAPAARYVIDTQDAHASVLFRVQHLGYSWLTGRFNQFEGHFDYDARNPRAARVAVTIETASVDSNHAERDKHLRSDDFLNVRQYPQARFISTGFEPTGDGTGLLTGDFTLNGITQPLTIHVRDIGSGPDPWGGYRHGFTGTARFALADYGITFNLGPKSKVVELELNVEGIRQ